MPDDLYLRFPGFPPVRAAGLPIVGIETADDVITAITRPVLDADAIDVLDSVPPCMVLAVADQLHIEAAGRGIPWVRKAILIEARS